MAKAVPTENFTRELKRFEHSIDVIDRKEPDLTDKQVIEVLIARDALQHLLENNIEETCEDIAQLHILDEQLQALGPTIAANVDMDNLSITLGRPEGYWWWQFKPPVDAWDRFDWLWNLVTIVLLALTASFMTNIYSAFSAGDATIASAFSMIIQLVGLIVVGSGAITEQGQERVQQVLNSLKIPSRFYAEASCTLALVLFLATYATNNYLDNGFASQGHYLYEEGRLTDAGQAYIQGMAIDSDNLNFHYNLGQVYESIGKLGLALEHYLTSSDQGDPKSLNALGRVVISYNDPVTRKNNPVLAEAYLLLGLQRAQTQPQTKPYLYYQLNRNIGWSLIEQEKYISASEYLETAMEWRSKVDPELHNPEGGMGNCFLAYAYDQDDRQADALEQWRKCVAYSRPNYIHEFRWLIGVGKKDVAYCVDTDKVVAGYEGQRLPEVEAFCEELFVEL